MNRLLLLNMASGLHVWLLSLLVALVVMGCTLSLPHTPTPAMWAYGCRYIAEEAIELSISEDDRIEDIYRLHIITDTDTLRECKGWSEWSRGNNRCIIVWVERRGADIYNGYGPC